MKMMGTAARVLKRDLGFWWLFNGGVWTMKMELCV